MLGYVMANKPEMRMREYEVYRSYYCGVCKSVGANHGQLPRLALSYDFAFLALLLASLSAEKEDAKMEHCLIHPVRKIPITGNSWEIDYAADMMVMLVYYNLLDDKNDEHKVRGTLGSMVFRGKAEKLIKKYPDAGTGIVAGLEELAGLEAGAAGAGLLDGCMGAFAKVMAAVFSNEFIVSKLGEANSRILAYLGGNLGRWIYLIDALDDLGDDVKSGSFNPLLQRFNYEEGESLADFYKRVRPSAEAVLYSCLGEIAKSFELLDVKKNRELLENIIFSGLEQKMIKIFEKNPCGKHE